MRLISSSSITRIYGYVTLSIALISSKSIGLSELYSSESVVLPLSEESLSLYSLVILLLNMSWARSISIFLTCLSDSKPSICLSLSINSPRSFLRTRLRGKTNILLSEFGICRLIALLICELQLSLLKLSFLSMSCMGDIISSKLG